MNLPSLLPTLLPAATLVGAWYFLRPGAAAPAATPAAPDGQAAPDEQAEPAPEGRGVVAPIRLGLIRMAVVVGAYATVGIEVLSAFHAVTRGGVIALWVVGLLAAGTGAVLRYRRETRAHGRGTPWWRGLGRDGTEPLAGQVDIAWLMVAGLIAIGVLTLILALAAAPNNWDSQAYHLPRVEQWVQNHSVGLFPSPFFSQNDLAPGAEFLLLHLRLLTGGDRLYNLVQWSAMLVCGLATSRVAAQLGAKRLGQVAAAFFFVTAPMVVLQSTSTQTDLVASAWAVAAATLALDAIWGSSRLTSLLLLGAAAGLAQNTKATGMISAWPMVALWFAVVAWRAIRTRSPLRMAKVAGSAVIVFAAALVIAGPFLVRMQDTYGSPLGPQVVRNHSMQRHDPAAVFINGLRQLQTVTMVPVRPIDTWTAHKIMGLGKHIGVSTADPRITEGPGFPVPDYNGPNEDLAAFPQQVAAVFIAIGYCLIRRRRDRPVLLYTLACLVVLLAFAGTLKWQLYVNRLLLPGLVVTTPLIGLTADAFVARVRRNARILAAVALTFVVATTGDSAVHSILDGSPRALAGDRSVLRETTWQVRFQHFYGDPQFFDDYVWATDTVKAAGAHRVGILTNNSSRWEYPLWLMLPGRTLVDLQSCVPGHPAPPAASVDAIIFEPPANQDCPAPDIPSDWVIQRHKNLWVWLPPNK